MDFWIKLWTIFFIASLSVFAGLAVIVTIAGFYNIKALLKGLIAAHKAQENSSEEVD